MKRWRFNFPPFSPGGDRNEALLHFHCRRLNPPSTRRRPRADRTGRRSHLEKQVELSYQGSDRTVQCKAKG